MNLQEWSFIAEIIASTSVVFSLCFLGFQIRLYTRQARRDALDLVTSRRYDIVRVLADDGELASIAWRGFAGTPRLPAHEWARFSIYMYTVLLEIERTWLKADAGTLDAEVLRAWEDASSWWLRYPGVRAWWTSEHPGFTPAFTLYVNGLMARVKVDESVAGVVAASFRAHERPQSGPGEAVLAVDSGAASAPAPAPAPAPDQTRPQLS